MALRVMILALKRLLADRAGGVALIVALALPILIGATGLCVDVGYWYQQQASLQTAADAAALAAARNNGTATGSYAETVAVAAANSATNNQFGFTTASITLNPAAPTSATTSFIATARIPRADFFTRGGSPLLAASAGYQYASATAQNTASAPACIYLNDRSAVQVLYASGGARISSVNCGINVYSTACNANNGDADSIAIDPSASVISNSIKSRGCIYANTNGGAYIGGTNSNTSVAQQNVSASAMTPSDPVSTLDSVPPWPLMPITPTFTGPVSSAIALGYNNNQGASGDCTYKGAYSGYCELVQGNYNNMTNIGVNGLVMNENTSTGRTGIVNGFTINTNVSLVMNGSSYYIAGGMGLTNGGTATISAASMNIMAGTTLQNGTVNLGTANSANVDYFSGASTASGTATTWGMSVSAPTLNVGPGTYYFNGGVTTPASNAAVSLGQGLYMLASYTSGSTFQSNSTNTATGALYDSNANITFTGGTYYFDGGLTLGGNATATFGPGIYYIRNGNLYFGAGSHVTANSATFVLEGTAGYLMEGGSVGASLSAPTSNCVNANSYPLSAYETTATATIPNGNAPYDGTDGEGICNVLIYQASGDATADYIIEGASTTISGAIYAPSAPLSISGGGAITINAPSFTIAGTQAVALDQDSLSLTGSGSLTVNSSSTTSSSGATASTLLVN